MKINNEIYNEMAHAWWDDNECGSLATLRFFGNVRFEYFKNILTEKLKIEYKGKTLLDVGCGGGLTMWYVAMYLNMSQI